MKSTLKKPIFKQYKIDLFDIDFRIYLVDSGESVRSIVCDAYKDELGKWGDYGGMVCNDKKGLPCILINSKMNKKNRLITLVHEAVHLSFSFADAIRVPVNVDTQEVTCYITDYVFRKGMDFVKAH